MRRALGQRLLSLGDDVLPEEGLRLAFRHGRLARVPGVRLLAVVARRHLELRVGQRTLVAAVAELGSHAHVHLAVRADASSWDNHHRAGASGII